MERWKILHSAKDLKQKRRNSERVVRTFRETHAISAMANSTSQDVSPSSTPDVRQKDKYTKKEPPPGGSFPLQYSFLINQHMKFLYGLRMHKLTRLRFLHQSSFQQMILPNDE